MSIHVFDHFRNFLEYKIATDVHRHYEWYSSGIKGILYASLWPKVWIASHFFWSCGALSNDCSVTVFSFILRDAAGVEEVEEEEENGGVIYSMSKREKVWIPRSINSLRDFHKESAM